MQLAIPVIQDGKAVGCLSASPFLMIDPSDLEINEVKRLMRGQKRKEDLLKALSSVTVVRDDQITRAAPTLFQVGDVLSEPGLGYLLKVREIQRLQGKIADRIGDLKDLDRDLNAPSLTRLSFEQEMELRSRIGRGDKTGAEEILYSLLAINLTQYLDNLELFKVSILELFAILSRVAVELGAKTEEVLGMRYACLTELASIDGHENICLWLVQAFERFISTVEATRRVKTDERLRKALDLIEVRYNTSLTVEEIARDVCLSPSRLCHIVQSELGLTLRAYITKVRVGKAKVLLLGTNMSISQIALEVGYPDQSYFTKAFKSKENCTPMTFRKSGFLTGFGRGLASIR
jgi:AraC-like DNA-binding protein